MQVGAPGAPQVQQKNPGLSPTLRGPWVSSPRAWALGGLLRPEHPGPAGSPGSRAGRPSQGRQAPALPPAPECGASAQAFGSGSPGSPGPPPVPTPPGVSEGTGTGSPFPLNAPALLFGCRPLTCAPCKHSPPLSTQPPTPGSCSDQTETHGPHSPPLVNGRFHRHMTRGPLPAALSALPRVLQVWRLPDQPRD